MVRLRATVASFPLAQSLQLASLDYARMMSRERSWSDVVKTWLSNPNRWKIAVLEYEEDARIDQYSCTIQLYVYGKDVVPRKLEGFVEKRDLQAHTYKQQDENQDLQQPKLGRIMLCTSSTPSWIIIYNVD
jgi:hypothetical protein